MATITEALQLAFQHHMAGRLDLAEQIYRRVLDADADQADAWHLLGVLTRDTGRHAMAVDYIGRAVALNPLDADYQNNWGIAFKEQGNVGEAMACYQRALRLRPDFAEAHNNFGNALCDQGLLDDAAACFRRALRSKPDFALALNNLGNALHARGQLQEAIVCYRRAVQLQPGFVQAYNNLGIALKDQGDVSGAIACYERALEREPKFAEAYSSLGVALKIQGKLDEAAGCYQHALQLSQNDAVVHNNLGNVFKEQGRFDEAVACYRRALELKPDHVLAGSNLLYTLHFCPEYDAAAIYREARAWNDRHAEPLAKQARPHANDRTRQRRLRIGYVSPDFRDHVVGRNVLPLLREHDHREFDVYCYADVLRPDGITERLRSCADGWREIVGLGDEQAAEMVRRDQIDILVDLSLHTAGSRLLIFARKPAPIQVTFAGYPGTTGLSAIDYRLTDPYLDPPGLDDRYYSEQSIRLPETFWCYDPVDHEPPVNGLPALEKGHITFGCLNTFSKINAPVLKLWAQVLHRVDRSRLIVRAEQGVHRQRALDLLEQKGISADRVTFVPMMPRAQYMAVYGQIDIGLDTFPYNGHTTSLESLWMGVPVITLIGRTAVGRAGSSQLTNLGLSEWATDAPEQFVRVAVERANDLPHLSALRATLRDRMQKSPLMDAPRFARSIEAAYRTMWQRWCAE